MRRPRSLAALLAGLLVLGQLASSAAIAVQPHTLTAKPLTPTERVSGAKSVSGKLAQTDKELLARTDRQMVNVMIKLDYDATAAYAGGVNGLAATSPKVTGRSLNKKATNVRRYEAYIARQEKSAIAALKKQVPNAKVGLKLHTVYGGFAATIPANSVRKILAIPGVAAVQVDRLEKPLTDASPSFINATSLYPNLGGTANSGSGVIFGDLDTGVWPEHASLADKGNLGAPPPRADATPRTCNFGDNPLTPANDPFVCQHKLIGGEPFLATYLSNPDRAADEPYITARDSNGHGTHTTTTAAGNITTHANPLGVDRGTVHGIAPGAWVIEYKVCGILGCFASDSAAAVAEAILDGVDVINFSISGGTNPFSDPVELAFLDAYAAGVFVATSAGNDGPDASTANHLSPWVVSTAASTQKRAFESTLTLSGGGATRTFKGASITAGISSATPVVLSSAAPYSNDFCGAPAAAGTFTGKIVACKRGGDIARVDKGYNVFQGGAVGMILYNPTLADVETDNHWLPTIHLANGTAFLAFLTAHPGATATFTAGQKVNGQGDVMAAFSSRGPAGLFIKPDVTAPGVQILAGMSPTPESVTEGPPGQYFQAIAGTSMSSPHVAGSAILLADKHPSWTPGQIKSALMTSAVASVVKEDLTTPADPFDFGAGRIDIGRADKVRLSFDETAAHYAAMAGDPVLAPQLNVPSLNAPVLPGKLLVNRKVKNIGGSTMGFTVVTHAPAASKITVSPSSFTLRAGASRTLVITIQTDAPLGVQKFGSIAIKPTSGVRQHIPVAFIHTQGDVSLTQDCSPTSIRQGQTSTCEIEATNNAFGETTVDLDTFTTSQLGITDASGATLVSGSHARRHNVTLAGAEPGIPDLAPGELFGYAALDSFGVDPELIGDEEIINFDVPSFEYAGDTWDSVGVDSNGYLIVGGGTSEDNECCTIPDGPDPSRPNNILAPFWTDLTGEDAPGIFAAVLSDDETGDAWVVLEWQVFVFGTSSNRHFQVWIGLNDEEDITYAYDPDHLPADPNGQDFAVRAENVIGQGDDVEGLPTEDLRVTSTDPVPGGSASYTLKVKGLKLGNGTVRTEMEADDVPGITVVKDTIHVR